MIRLIRGLALSSLCLSLAACGASKYYSLPVDSSRATETRSNLAACATQQGLESQPMDPDGVSVRYDAASTLYYRYDGSDTYTLQVVVDDKAVPAPELDARFTAARQKGEALYACAQDQLNTRLLVTAAAPTEPTATASVTAGTATASITGGSATASVSGASTSASVHVNGGTCAQATECYARLARSVCEGAQECSFKVSIQGNDEANCRDALLRVPDLLQPFKLMRPDLAAPAICKVD
ncbi:hypothetical protein JGU66_13025 [Myxococcaceae bacterium JPH2]|nr:hypothetical protein [Myxococcaceae bacterium JPH2]